MYQNDQNTCSPEEEKGSLTNKNQKLNDAHNKMQIVDEQLRRLRVEMNHTELEWLQLCNVAHHQQPISPPETKSVKPLFKDAEDINATSLELDIQPVQDDASCSDME